jgi:hypothetical protein
VSRFVITGVLDGRVMTLGWEDGYLFGDVEAEAEMLLVVRDGEMIPLTPTGPVIRAALTPGWVAEATAVVRVFDHVLELESDVEWPDLGPSPGAIP